MEEVKIYIQMALASIKSRMEYKASFIIFLFTIFAFYVAQVLAITAIIFRFQSIGGWSMGEMAFLYSLLVLSQGLVACGFGGLLDFGTLIRTGNFDRAMIRPLSPLIQVLMNDFDLTGFVHVVLGILAVSIANSFLQIKWDALKIFVLVLVVLGGSCILASIRILIASVAFWAVENSSLIHLFVFSSREFLLYPMNIYSKGVKFLLTFLIPLGFINFYPAHFFLNKDTSSLFHPYFIFGTFPVGISILILSLYVWKLGQNAYESAGG